MYSFMWHYTEPLSKILWKDFSLFASTKCANLCSLCSYTVILLPMNMLRSLNNNKAKSFLTFGCCLPKFLLICYVKTFFNH